MVCMAVFLSSQAQDMTGKMVGIWFPISAFVMMGMEHSVANMFMLPLGLICGSHDPEFTVTTGDIFVKNMIPVSLGNLFAGAICVAASYSYAFGKMGKTWCGLNDKSNGCLPGCKCIEEMRPWLEFIDPPSSSPVTTAKGEMNGKPVAAPPKILEEPTSFSSETLVIAPVVATSAAVPLEEAEAQPNETEAQPNETEAQPNEAEAPLESALRWLDVNEAAATAEPEPEAAANVKDTVSMFERAPSCRSSRGEGSESSPSAAVGRAESKMTV